MSLRQSLKKLPDLSRTFTEVALAVATAWSTIRKSVKRFSEKIMLKQESRARWRFPGALKDWSSFPAAGEAD
jgi:hypothetical protein